MNRNKPLHRRPRSFSFPLAVAFLLCLTGFGERALFALNPHPSPRVGFDQTEIIGDACTPSKAPDVPRQVLIGERFTFKVRFKNQNPTPGNTKTGYGPFIDLVFDAGGANINKSSTCLPCDGMTFVSASMIGVSGGPSTLTPYVSQAPCTPSPLPQPQVALPHPFALVNPVMVNAGSQLVTLELPFGMFDPTQPEVVVEVTAFVSPNADVNRPFYIYARGGFRYGASPVNGSAPIVSDIDTAGGQQTDSTQWSAKPLTNPTVMIVSKTYLGPEDETVTGPNFTSQYAITLDIAKGAIISGLTLTDTIPGTMVFDSVVSAPLNWVPPGPLPAGPGGSWTAIAPPGPITGVMGPDATVVVAFHIPLKDDNGADVLPLNCDAVPSFNFVQAFFDFEPQDPCDGGSTPYISTAQHELFSKCLAIQKSVAVVPTLDMGAPGPTPGDTLAYTLQFQVSDAKNMGDIKIHDVLSDGQTLVTLPSSTVPAVTLSVTDQCGSVSGQVPAAAIQVVDQCPSGPSGQLPSRTTLDIDVSLAIASLGGHPSGILRGGYTTTPGSTIPATGVITFRTVIDDKYCPVVPPHDVFVDKDDPLSNNVTITATVYDNKPLCTDMPSPTSVIATDDSKTCTAIVSDVLQKTVYAVTRGGIPICGPNTSPPTLCSAPDVMPGDEVTFRLVKTIPSSDAENLMIQDWLPLPVLDVDDPAATGTAGHASSWAFDLTACGIPAPGHACLGPTDTLLPLLPSPPTLAAEPLAPLLTNSIKFSYGSFNDPANMKRIIDLLFTLKITAVPFPDALYLTNEAQECEDNTFGVTFCQAAIAQIHVREPALKITKGVVAASNPNAVFSPPPHTQVGPIGPVPFNSPGSSCPRFSQTINSTNLAAAPINSDVFNVDANDCVTFAIVVENTGGSTAYDVQLRDFFPLGPTDAPSCFLIQSPLCVTDGTHTQIPFVLGPGRSLPITLSHPLPGVSSTSTPGSNIVVITFDACVASDITPGCCDNTAAVEHYASTPNGPDFVDAGFGGPFRDAAEICVRPTAAKSIKTTSEPHTPGTPNGPPLSPAPEQLAIGEIIRYRLEVVVPETTTATNYTLTDLLPPGLRFLDDQTTTLAFVSNGPSGPGVTSTTPSIGSSPFMPGNQQNLSTITPVFKLPQASISGGPFACAGPPNSPSFNLGGIANTDNDSDQEFIVLEFNALVCNIVSNQDGTALANSFNILVGGQLASASNTVQALIVEPHITINKAATVTPSLTSGATATYTVTLTNNGTATAFDVHLIDQLPACLTKLHVALITTSGGVTGLMDNSPPTMLALDVTAVSIPVGGTVTVTYTATVTCLDCNKLINTSAVTWTSLPGPGGTTANPPNTTGSVTPGASGHPDGERDGSGGVNDYVATAAATLCCMFVTDERIDCNPNGSFTYTFTVNSGLAISGINVLSPANQPMNVTITPGPITGLPMSSQGGSAAVSVVIEGTGAVSGANVCFSMVLTGGGGVICRPEQCVTLPKCCVMPPSDMEAWYPLDESTGAVSVVDISGNNHTGTAQLGPVDMNGPFSNFPNPPAVVGGSLYFFAGQSSLSYVTVPDNPALSLDIGPLDFTIDAWIYANAGPAPIVDKFEAASQIGYRLYLGAPVTKTDATLYFTYGDGVTSLTVPSVFPIPFQQWHHVAVTVHRSAPPATPYYFQVLFYVDGTPEGGVSVLNQVGSIVNALPLFIGGFHPPPPVTGATEIGIDELELFHRALSQTEIHDIWDAGSAGKCQLGHRIGVIPVRTPRPPARHVPRR